MKRRLALLGEINDAMFQYLFIHTHRIKEQPIEIMLSTHGGDYYTALGIYDYIRSLPVHVTIRVCGPCFSAGMIVLQAADWRTMSPNSYLMIHYGDDHVSSINDLEQNKRTVKQFGDILLSRSKHTRKKMQTWFNTDEYMEGKAALEAGLIDDYEPKT